MRLFCGGLHILSPASYDINRLLYGYPPILQGLNSWAIFPKADPDGARRHARDRLLVRRPIILSLGSNSAVTRIFTLY